MKDNPIVNITRKLAEDLKRMTAEGTAVRKYSEPLNCLIVEDNDDDAFLSTRALKSLGIEVSRARNGYDAARMLVNTENPSVPNYHIVFLDLILPGGPNGIEVLKFIRERFPALHVVIISSMMEDPEFFAAARQYGYFGVVTKPLTPVGVEEIIEKHHL